MKEANRIKAQEQIRNNRVFRTMNHLQQILDEYYLDGIIGLIPYGIGDLLTAIFGLLYIWFAFGKVKSLPLTLAILNNWYCPIKVCKLLFSYLCICKL